MVDRFIYCWIKPSFIITTAYRLARARSSAIINLMNSIAQRDASAFHRFLPCTTIINRFLPFVSAVSE